MFEKERTSGERGRYNISYVVRGGGVAQLIIVLFFVTARKKGERREGENE
jgi:hypothetical protein